MKAPRGADSPQRQPRSLVTLLIVGLLALTGAAGCMTLALWQIERRAWKLALIERIAKRIHAPPTAAPGPEQWPAVTPASAEYRHVTATGMFLSGTDTQVRGVSDLGAGYWLLTPMKTTTGFTVLINRGFVPDEPPNAVIATNVEALQITTGLLRISEPKGRFLRANDPAKALWYSRDVAAIADMHHLSDVAPYFIDLDGPPVPTALPVTGLTVLQFPNNHLQYAMTWFALGLMVMGCTGYVGHYEWRLRQTS